MQRSWDEDDCLRYALAVGAGRDELHLTTESTEGVALQALPTMGALVAAPDAAVLLRARDGGPGGVHGEQVVELLRPLPTRGEVLVRTEVLGVEHKGAGARITVGVEASSADGSGPLVVSRSSFVVPGRPTEVARRCGELTRPFDDEDLDEHVTIPTHPAQALWYRLCGDRNPLHSDPAVARRAGFDEPILHGLCSFGIVGRVLVERCAAGDPARVRSMGVRFSAPLVPGEDLHLALMRRDGAVRFRATSGGRVILDRGTFVVGQPPGSVAGSVAVSMQPASNH